MIIDTNVHLSRWPFRRLAGDEPAELVAKLRKHNVTQAWAGSFDGILHKDIAGVNARLANDCRTFGQGILIPFGSINLKLPDWREDLRRCHEVHKMLGIRLHPNYHGYDLTDPALVGLLKEATARRLIVQLALCMEDVRTQHPLARVPPVDVAPLAELVRSVPGVRLVVLNCTPIIRLEQLRPVSSAGEVYFDFSMVEGIGGVARLVERVSLERAVFGSNYPLFYFESALLKVQESGLGEVQKKALLEENARRLIARAASRASLKPFR